MKARVVRIDRVWKNALYLTVALAILCTISGHGDASSVAFGGLFSVANFHLIRVLVSRLMTPGVDGGRTSAVLGAKFLLLLALLAVCLARWPVEPLSFVVGIATIVVAIVLDGVLLGEPVRDGDGADAS